MYSGLHEFLFEIRWEFHCLRPPGRPAAAAGRRAFAPACPVRPPAGSAPRLPGPPPAGSAPRRFRPAAGLRQPDECHTHGVWCP